MKWFWKAPMRSLPQQTANRVGTKSVKWLSEVASYLVSDVANNGAKEVMLSQEFLDIVQPYCSGEGI